MLQQMSGELKTAPASLNATSFIGFNSVRGFIGTEDALNLADLTPDHAITKQQHHRRMRCIQT